MLISWAPRSNCVLVCKDAFTLCLYWNAAVGSSHPGSLSVYCFLHRAALLGVFASLLQADRSNSSAESLCSLAICWMQREHLLPAEKSSPVLKKELKKDLLRMASGFLWSAWISPACCKQWWNIRGAIYVTSLVLSRVVQFIFSGTGVMQDQREGRASPGPNPPPCISFHWATPAPSWKKSEHTAPKASMACLNTERLPAGIPSSP